MSHQMQFFLLPQDLADLEVALRAKHDIAVIGHKHKRGTVLGRSNLNRTLAASDGLVLYLVEPGRIEEVLLTGSPKDPDVQWVDVTRSPVIEVSRCFTDGKVLRRGRMYYTAGFYRPQERWAEKSAAFTQWAHGIFRAAKRHLHRDPQLDAYLRDAARRWKDDGGELVWM